MLTDEQYMQLALEEAKKAATMNETPVGAVIVNNADGEIVGKGYNTTERDHSPLAHAELNAIRKATRRLDTKWLTDCTIYVTLEPCPMCAGAISSTRIKRLVYGAFDEKGGACASLFNLYDYPVNHKPMVRSRVLEAECGAVLSEFFKKLRNQY
ncbi:MAG: tRNA adenosine(34) deaminase TadA [Oscillospiraceae bacterium]|jgi:tRNA(adenine34) deaminase|nr:tRNA adenosine(34) deaminase TadA [Oscillospiraceae bacterium]